LGLIGSNLLVGWFVCLFVCFGSLFPV